MTVTSQSLIVDFVDDPLVSLTQPVGSRVGSNESFGLQRARIVGEHVYSLFYSFPISHREFPQSPIRRAGHE